MTTTGSSTRDSAATAGRIRSAYVVRGSPNGRSGVITAWPAARRRSASGRQQELSCHLPWIRQYVAMA
jgi:hypothetical protein